MVFQLYACVSYFSPFLCSNGFAILFACALCNISKCVYLRRKTITSLYLKMIMCINRNWMHTAHFSLWRAAPVVIGNTQTNIIFLMILECTIFSASNHKHPVRITRLNKLTCGFSIIIVIIGRSRAAIHTPSDQPRSNMQQDHFMSLGEKLFFSFLAFKFSQNHQFTQRLLFPFILLSMYLPTIKYTS